MSKSSTQTTCPATEMWKTSSLKQCVDSNLGICSILLYYRDPKTITSIHFNNIHMHSFNIFHSCSPFITKVPSLLKMHSFRIGWPSMVQLGSWYPTFTVPSLWSMTKNPAFSAISLILLRVTSVGVPSGLLASPLNFCWYAVTEMRKTVN